MIHVIATIAIVPGQRKAFLAIFRELVPTVRAEEGCIEYGPAIDLTDAVAGQSSARPDTVTVIEKWADVAALRRHLESAHMLHYRDNVKELVTGVEIRVLEPA
ncbi:MAG TPA: putative quinol monooxygenase [Lacipirellulaceae bacterium]|nr:putative quinol monooxygenase [Lacipirellulaceae bacterium]